MTIIADTGYWNERRVRTLPSEGNWIKRVPGDGAYTTTETLAIWVAAQPSADDTAFTPYNGSALTSIAKESFTEGQVYYVHAKSVTVGTDGIFYLAVP